MAPQKNCSRYHHLQRVTAVLDGCSCDSQTSISSTHRHWHAINNADAIRPHLMILNSNPKILPKKSSLLHKDSWPPQWRETPARLGCKTTSHAGAQHETVTVGECDLFSKGRSASETGLGGGYIAGKQERRLIASPKVNAPKDNTTNPMI
jgi:hypothetical protein